MPRKIFHWLLFYFSKPRVLGYHNILVFSYFILASNLLLELNYSQYKHISFFLKKLDYSGWSWLRLGKSFLLGMQDSSKVLALEKWPTTLAAFSDHLQRNPNAFRDPDVVSLGEELWRVFLISMPNDSMMEWGQRTATLEKDYKKFHFTREDPTHSKITVKPTVRGYSAAV